MNTTTSRKKRPSASATDKPPTPAESAPSQASGEAQGDATRFPVETDIFIQPDGSVVIADLPKELDALLTLLNAAKPAL